MQDKWVIVFNGGFQLQVYRCSEMGQLYVRVSERKWRTIRWINVGSNNYICSEEDVWIHMKLSISIVSGLDIMEAYLEIIYLEHGYVITYCGI